VKRDWTAARAKCSDEAYCRVGGHLHGYVDAAHIIPRSRIPGAEAMDAHNIVPLCRQCHHAYDERRELDLLPYLSKDEQAYAVLLVGLAEAYTRITNGPWPA
jgi:5-methylcytosine-specific restriction endonuclease McrA